MSRVPGTRSSWILSPNLGYADKEPRPLKVECHDGTPFLTIICSCAGEMHLHESQLTGMPPGTEVASTCKSCGKLLVFPPGSLEAGFEKMREEGWIE